VNENVVLGSPGVCVKGSFRFNDLPDSQLPCARQRRLNCEGVPPMNCVTSSVSFHATSCPLLVRRRTPSTRTRPQSVRSSGSGIWLLPAGSRTGAP
jgi:hypothetical protein